MSILDALRPFKKRLMREALLRSAVLSGMIAACVAMILGVIHLLFPWMVTRLGIILTFAGVFAAGFGLLLLCIYRPSKRDVAKRLDALGLSERVETMLEYEHSTSPAASLQRKDTLDRLKAVKAKDIRLKIPKTLSVVCAVCFVCATVLLLLPEVNAFSRHPLINALREQISDSHISEKLEDALEEIIDELEKKLEESEDGQGTPEDLENAGQQISDAVDEEITKDEIGEALQGFKDLAELGEAIQNGDKEGVSAALDKLTEQMQNNPSEQESISEQLQSALELAGTPEDNDLHEALDNMAENLQNTDKPLDETMQEAETEINEALDKQQAAEQLREELQEMLQNAMPSDSSEEGEGQEGQGQSGSQGEAEKPNQGDQQGGGSDSSQDNGQNGPGNGSGGDSGMNEMIQDPEEGQVNYGNVYAGYFAEFLDQVDTGELPDSVVEAMNEYLENLKNGKGE